MWSFKTHLTVRRLSSTSKPGQETGSQGSGEWHLYSKNSSPAAVSAASIQTEQPQVTHRSLQLKIGGKEVDLHSLQRWLIGRWDGLHGGENVLMEGLKPEPFQMDHDPVQKTFIWPLTSQKPACPRRLSRPTQCINLCKMLWKAVFPSFHQLLLPVWSFSSQCGVSPPS